MTYQPIHPDQGDKVIGLSNTLQSGKYYKDKVIGFSNALQPGEYDKDRSYAVRR